MLSALRFVTSIAWLVLTAHLISLAGSVLPFEVRAMVPVTWISNTLVTQPLGPAGGWIWFGACIILFAVTKFWGFRSGEADERGDARRSSAEPVRARRAKRGARAQPQPDTDYSIDEILASANWDRDFQPTLAWQIVAEHPHESSTSYRSWIGGAPVGPPDIEWPRLPSGQPMMFLMQIDCADLDRSRGSHPLPLGVPSHGAFLVWLGSEPGQDLSYRITLLSGGEMAGACDLPIPANAQTSWQIGIGQVDLLQPTKVALIATIDTKEAAIGSKFRGVEVGDDHGYHFNDDEATALYIEFKEQFGLTCEHWLGLSIACRRDDLARGEYNRGRIVGVSAV